MNFKMNTSPVLPKSREALGRVINEHVCLEDTRMQARWTRFWLATQYLMGVRRFEAYDADNRNFAGFSVDKDGKIPLQVPELLNHVNKVTGLIQGMDMWPSVSRRGDSLGLIRDGACTQVLLDSVVNEEQLAEIKTSYGLHCSNLGSCGINGTLVDVPSVGITADLEVVHPGEIYPFPGLVGDMTKQRGILWVRKVPVTKLKKLFGSVVSKGMGEMEVWRRRVAEIPTLNQGTIQTTPGAGSTMQTQVEDDTYLEARVWELWVDGPVGTCARWAVGSGPVCFKDVDFEEEGGLYYRTLGFGRFWENHTFHGAGLFDAIFTMCRELEHGVKSVINNIRDMDRYPITLIPAGVLNERVMADKGHSARFVTIKQDPSLLGGNEFRPLVIQPANAGDTPGRTSVYMESLIASRVPVRDIIKEKGRVDSYTGLQYLEENSQSSSIIPIANTVRAFGQCYRGIARNLVAGMMRSAVTLPVKRLDLSLAGAMIDFKTSRFGFKGNSPPDISRLSFSVKETNPRSKSLRKQEATGFLTMQTPDGSMLTTVNRYILLALKEGWDPALYMEAEIAAVRTVTYNILALYGDGEEPNEQEIWMTPQSERPDIQLEVLDSFLATVLFHAASEKVAEGLLAYRETLMGYQGKMLPMDIPDPEESTLQSAEGADTVSEEPQPSLE